ncbi:glycosyltransferase [Sodalis ligni]|uniref:Glycosyltransferase involved in cell wall biosynthesis n=1 Tax=Sodalis ligni TaxID=2697027 RepID=A0A4R1NHV5_9GAMM|nr:glycosyltransferase [Sodalis ligni]TCL07334.1 glycosyltransferase involved in cell wall biosynthesis [Sodalis ligni]
MKIFIVQPKLASYRIPVYENIAKENNTVYVFHEGALDGSDINIPLCQSKLLRRYSFSKIYYQKGLLEKIIKEKPDKIFYYADLKNLTLWFSLILAKIFNIEIYLHGQGLFKKIKIHITDKLIWSLALAFCTKFIAYNQYVSDEMERAFPSSKNKISKCDNTLEDSQLYEMKPLIEDNNGILFIGRIRDGVNLDLLIEAVQIINNKHNEKQEKYSLHIIGDGEMLEEMKREYNDLDFIKWYGKIYSHSDIELIARQCSIGVYPGDGGLSVVHYMALGLFPLVHGSWKRHMGPEPWYVKKYQKNIYLNVIARNP